MCVKIILKLTELIEAIFPTPKKAVWKKTRKNKAIRICSAAIPELATSFGLESANLLSTSNQKYRVVQNAAKNKAS